jgi:hypothetical protein
MPKAFQFEFRRQVRRSKLGPLTLLTGFAVVTWATALGAQAGSGGGRHWTVDPRTSLVWWQIDPHYNHLWATTCPNDPAWQPGEGRDAGWQVNYRARPVLRDVGTSDGAVVPLFPRIAVHPNCRQAVHGEVVANGERWQGAQGKVVVAVDSFETGLRTRDSYARSHVLDTSHYPTVEFTIDSLVNVQPGDTIRAIAAGTLTLHGVRTPHRVPVVAWREASGGGGGLRVQGHFSFSAPDLVEVYGLSPAALLMGVLMHRWKVFYLGLDLVLREAGN